MARPVKFKNVEELEEKIEEYKAYLDKSGNPPTMAGLAYFIGLDRKSIFNYQRKDQFFPTLKKFRDWIMMNYEEIAIAGKQPSGVIFLLKNYGYTDRQEVEHSGEVGIEVKWTE